MKIRLRNAERAPLEDHAKVSIYRQSDRRLEAEVAAHKGVKEITVEGLLSYELYSVRVFPKKHRPAHAFARGASSITIHCPVDPDHVKGIAVHSAETAGDLIKWPPKIEEKQLAGFLNVLAKMEATPVLGLSAASHIGTVTRINEDRFWFEPSAGLYGAVKAEPEFHEAPGGLHELLGYDRIGSFKTGELYGNLQLTFFLRKNGARGPREICEADVDDAGGILHAFQVLRNALTGRKTDPYDIHEILTFYQEIDTGYSLIV